MSDPIKVRGNSLTGVVESGDEIVILPFIENVKRDQLIVFKESENQVSIKQCKGKPGDQLTINSETGEIFVNGHLQKVKLDDKQKVCWKDWLKFSPTVPHNHLFLLGTIDSAIDSRSRGYFSFSQVVGIAEKVILNT